MNVGRVVVCTFATPEYEGSAEVLRHTALDYGGADAVVVYGPRDVQPLYDAYPELLKGHTRGYGWWSWKPWCIRETLRRHSRPGDVVVWADAGMTFQAPLRPYVDALARAQGKSVLLFRLGGWASQDHTITSWTKRDAIALMGMNDDEHRTAHQVNAALQLWRHEPSAMRLLDDYATWCCNRNVVDDAHALENYAGFRDHRHDQSVLSLLAVGCPIVQLARDPTQHGRDDPTGVPGVLDFEGPQLVDHHRQMRRPIRVAVITSTTGGPYLRSCIASVQAQELPNVVHYVVVDGPEHEADVRGVTSQFAGRKPLHVAVLPHNVGAGGWNGHRVYGSWPFLVDADFVAFLDDDNEFDPDHLRLLLRHVVTTGASWGYALRRIVDREGAEVCPDNCESLGGICPSVLGRGDRLIDTSCYLLERDLAIRAAHAWNARFRDPAGKPEPDRELCKVLLSTAPHVVARRHSVRYRVGSTDASVAESFFLQGNERMGYDFARFDDLYVFHFSQGATARFLATRRKRDRSYALDEWQMTLLRGLDGYDDGKGGQGDDEVKRFNLLDGYACAPNVPPGGCVLVNLCQPHEVPWDFLKARTDCWRVAYTLESPNIRHAAQWDPELLRQHFDVVLTYWKPLLDDPRLTTVFCAHNTHHLDLDDPMDRAQMRANADASGRSCGMVLERRPGLRGTFKVPNVPDVELRCLDPLREAFVKDLRDVTVYGVGWDEFVASGAAGPGVKLGHALHRSKDDRHAVDILQNHTFAVIVENVDAEGYASEKLYDALLAGCIPLYYGRVPAQLDSHDGLYVDLYSVLGPDPDPHTASQTIQRFMDGLSDEQIAAWKARVAAGREAVLRQVDTAAFARAVNEALAARPI